MSYSTTTHTAGQEPGTVAFDQDSAWYDQAISFLRGIFTSCAERNPATWQEHFITRCLKGQRWDGTPCPGTPDPRRAALAAARDPETAGTIAGKLREWNQGWAPSVRDMAVPENAILWTFAVAGGLDCRNSRSPSYPDEVWEWIRRVTPGWTPTGPDPVAPTTSPPEGEAGWAEFLLEARRRGEDIAQAAVEEAARWGFSQLPEDARRALAALQADYYGGQARDQLQAALPWIIGGGLALAFLRR